MREISMGKKLAYGIIALNRKNGRRSITLNEYNIFSKYLHRNLDFIDDWMHEEARKEVENYFDKVYVDREIIYRLKPQYTIRDLEKNFFVLWTDLYIVINKKDATYGLDDLTYEDEQNLEEFKIIDERYQLKMLRDVCECMKKRNDLLKNLEVIRHNSISLVDMEGIKPFLKLTSSSGILKLESYCDDLKR